MSQRHPIGSPAEKSPATGVVHRPSNCLSFRSPKIQTCHVERRAIVYIRQSTPAQVIEHQESKDRQYSLFHRAIDLGWTAEQIEVIDEDQGLSGATAEGRLGFQRLLAEVGLNHVGIILGLEVSRLARSCKDWYQLLELCALFRTLVADQDGVYDPNDPNDKLLLGLKGTMSEAELHVLRGRLNGGRLNKARRGELHVLPPPGYVKRSSQGFDLDPDEQVQSVVRLVFDQFDRLGTLRGVLRYLTHHGIRIGIRPHWGPNKGNLEWRMPTRDAVETILKDPIYAGTYRYGCRQIDPRRKKPGQPGSGRVKVPPEQYLALLPDRYPAYITHAHYEANQKRLASNRARNASAGAPREGPSLLGGLVRCGRCDRRMLVRYGRSGRHTYSCVAAQQNCRGPTCQCVAGRFLDTFISEQVLVALEPAALELSLSASADMRQERERLNQLWQQRLERARYQVDRAERQYQAVEPENRLVARTLEQHWEQALQELHKLEGDYACVQREQPKALSVQEQERIRALAADLPALWKASTTTAMDRQRILRYLVQQVVVNVEGNTNRVRVMVEWTGGFTSQHELLRPVLSYQQMVDNDRLLERLGELRAAGLSFERIAQTLNAEGFHPSKRTLRFSSDIVGILWRRHFANRQRPRREVPPSLIHKHEWTALGLAKELKMPKGTLLVWARKGWVRFRSLPGYHGSFLCWADRAELKRLRKLRSTPHGWWDPPLPADLTTPRRAPDSPIHE
jgi:DNA invertase Pin-like site-specific DNA recombinase